jgi:hypothetical protein
MQYLIILELLLQYGPDVAAAARTILQTKDPTEDQWKALFDAARKSFDASVPQIPDK